MSCENTVRPAFIHHYSAAVAHPFLTQFSAFAVQIVFRPNPLYPTDIDGLADLYKVLYRTVVTWSFVSGRDPVVPFAMELILF